MPALDHIGIAVADYERARALFLDVFGAEVVREGDTGIVKWGFFGFDNIVVVLFENHDPDLKWKRLGGPDVKGRVEHLAFAFDDLDGAVARFQSGGVRFLDQTMTVEDYKIAYPDPDSTTGVRFQVLNLPARR